MKILLNQISAINNFRAVDMKKQNMGGGNPSNTQTVSKFNALSLARFPNISFMAKPDASFILAHTPNICAYSRKPLLTSYELRSINARLSKKNNAQSAVNFLCKYENYMPDVETQVFDFLKNNANSGKKTFQDILYEKRDDSMDKLRKIQARLLDSNETDQIIESLHGQARAYVDEIRDKSIFRIYDGTFSRQNVLSHLDSIKTSSENAEKISDLYNLWYRLPRSFMDFDAFVVKYSYMPHEVIMQRLLSMSEKTVEHLIPTARGGEDNLGNYAPVMKLYNNDRQDMSLIRYDALNPEIGLRTNLQKYIDDICGEINNEKTVFATRSWYPKVFRLNVLKETDGNINLKIKDSKSKNVGKIPSSHKGKNRYISYRR